VEDSKNPKCLISYSGDILATFEDGDTAELILNFKNDLNTPSGGIIGLPSSNAAIVKIYAVYHNGLEYVTIPLFIRIQDCMCCGAKISSTEWKQFMCHNLGADYTEDPFAPMKAATTPINYSIGKKLVGNYYQWGTNVSVANADSNRDQSGSWNKISPDADAWSDGGVKGPKDPCPEGWRVPTQAQWQAVIQNNPLTTTITNTPKDYTSWQNYAINFSSGKRIGKSLFLPTCGKFGALGTLDRRGSAGNYWSSSTSVNLPATCALSLLFTENTFGPLDDTDRFCAVPIRCISE
jgi:uncharacterized protein (TIGR02145 family)